MEEKIKEIIKRNTTVSENTNTFLLTDTDTEKIAEESFRLGEEEGRREMDGLLRMAIVHLPHEQRETVLKTLEELIKTFFPPTEEVKG